MSADESPPLGAGDRARVCARRTSSARVLALVFLVAFGGLLTGVGSSDVAVAQTGDADLSLSKADSPDPAYVGEDLTYTLTAANAGPDQAEGVTVSDPLPAAVTYVSASASQGSCTEAAGTVECSLGALANAASATVTIVVRPTAPGTLSNTATVSSTTADPDPANNSDTETTEVAPARPNIVVVMTDDQAALDGRLLQFQPNVKSTFVEQGVTFSDFHSETPLCCPARAGFFSGQHTHNHKVVTNKASLFKPAMSVATALRGVGYHTLLVGKYMNQYDTCTGPNCAPNVPPGWNRWVAFAHPEYYNYGLFIDGGATPESHGTTAADYSTDVLAQKSVALIESAPAGRPVFAWIAPYAPHAPSTPAPRHLSAPCAVQAWSPPNWNEADVSDKPLYVRNTALRKNPNSFKPACRALLAVDDLVGSVRDALSRSGRLGNTLFVYTGDNGMNAGEHRLVDKSAPYQTQVPFLVSWPDQLGTTPRTIPERVQNIDLAPTLCVFAGCTLGPYPNGQLTPDGISFADLLLGQASSLPRDAVLDEFPKKGNGVPAWHAVTTTQQSALAFQGCAAAASGGCKWHYIEYPATLEKELYDISSGPCWTWTVGAPGDPCELDNAIANPAYANIVTALAARLAQLRVEKGQP